MLMSASNDSCPSFDSWFNLAAERQLSWPGETKSSGKVAAQDGVHFSARAIKSAKAVISASVVGRSHNTSACGKLGAAARMLRAVQTLEFSKNAPNLNALSTLACLGQPELEW